MNFLKILFLSLALRPAYGLEVWTTDADAAMAKAREKHSLVLLDFYAPWCYSCYYMDRNVLHEPLVLNFRNQLELVKMDVDSPEGARLEREHEVHGLPNYVILNPQGEEVGRIVGEQTPTDFVSQLRAILAKNFTLSELETRAQAGGGSPALSAAREVLHAYVQRQTPADGMKFYENLPGKLRNEIKRDPKSLAELLRLQLFSAKNAKNGAACEEPARGLLSMPVGCDTMYDFYYINDCLELAPESKRNPLYALEKKPLQELLRNHILIDSQRRCADFRTAVEVAVDLDERTGAKEEASGVLSQAIDLMRGELGADLSKDRNKADNLRVLLEMAGRDQELEALYPKLISAYPKDYVYPYRYGKYLAQHGRTQEALAQFDASTPLAYGANRIRVAEQRARCLAQLGKNKEALETADKALSQDGSAFPTEVASLKNFRDELSKGKL